MNLLLVLLALGCYPETFVVTSASEIETGYTVCRDFNGNE